MGGAIFVMPALRTPIALNANRKSAVLLVQVASLANFVAFVAPTHIPKRIYIRYQVTCRVTILVMVESFLPNNSQLEEFMLAMLA
tara:strand:- start:657 stop:911 length:255 start_codon:yes stop_codon:yes gene_type:complete